MLLIFDFFLLVTRSTEVHVHAHTLTAQIACYCRAIIVCAKHLLKVHAQ